jgi:L-lactate dehydrogenase complex protein LldG
VPSHTFPARGDVDVLRARFVQRARTAGADVYRCQRGELQRALPEIMGERAQGGVGLAGCVPDRFPELCIRATVERQHPEVAITCADFGIADVGSVALRDSPVDRSLWLLSFRHVVLLPERALVGTIAEAVRHLAEWQLGPGAPYVTFVTGPSRTSDIERVSTIGAHGPPELAIVVVAEGAVDDGT